MGYNKYHTLTTRGLHFSHFIVEIHAAFGEEAARFCKLSHKKRREKLCRRQFYDPGSQRILWLILIWQEPLRWNAIMILDRSPFEESLNPLDLIEVSLAVFKWKAIKNQVHFIETFHLNELLCRLQQFCTN